MFRELHLVRYEQGSLGFIGQVIKDKARKIG